MLEMFSGQSSVQMYSPTYRIWMQRQIYDECMVFKCGSFLKYAPTSCRNLEQSGTIIHEGDSCNIRFTSFRDTTSVLQDAPL